LKVHVITDAARLGEAAIAVLLEALASSPPDHLQIREKHDTDRAILDRAIRCRDALGGKGAVLVNGRPDIAVAAGAAGAHLPSDGLPVADVRAAFPRPFLIGVSCHALDELEESARAGADYALLGPIYPPTSKAATGPPLGPESLDALPDPPPLPVFALGGITLERVLTWSESRRRRVAGVAGIGLFSAGTGETRRRVEAIRSIEGAP